MQGGRGLVGAREGSLQCFYTIVGSRASDKAGLGLCVTNFECPVGTGINREIKEVANEQKERRQKEVNSSERRLVIVKRNRTKQ